MSDAHAPVLQVSALQVSYAGNRAVDVGALAVGRGEVVGVVGANGAGKSTLVNALAGWSRGEPTVTGEVRLGGKRLDQWPTHRRIQAGLLLVPEGRLVFGSMSVEENLTTVFDPAAQAPRDPSARMGTAADGRRIYSRDDVYELFPRLKERRGHLGSQLSGGERQMLGIGRALMMGPRVLLMDEPSIGLAPKLVSQVLHTMRMLAQSGLSILLVEQNVRAAIEVVDRLVLLERGRIVKEGPAKEMADDPLIVQAYLGGGA